MAKSSENEKGWGAGLWVTPGVSVDDISQKQSIDRGLSPLALGKMMGSFSDMLT